MLSIFFSIFRTDTELLFAIILYYSRFISLQYVGLFPIGNIIRKDIKKKKDKRLSVDNAIGKIIFWMN